MHIPLFPKATHSVRVTLDVQTTALTEDDVEKLAEALDTQVNDEFMEHWGIGAIIDYRMPNERPRLGVWVLALLDNSDQAGALGYHYTTDAGMPMGKVFVQTDKDHGLSWSVTASHELLEMLGDPFANSVVQVGEQLFVGLETADAVEADSLGYDINGVRVSDFMLPSWFVTGSPGPWDQEGHCSGPLQVLPGGYCGTWTPNTGWQQILSSQGARHADGPRWQLRTRTRLSGMVEVVN